MISLLHVIVWILGQVAVLHSFSIPGPSQLSNRSNGLSLTRCTAPKEVGTCNNPTTAWYYDLQQDKCYYFLYSGCGGNANRYSSRSDCNRSCQKTKRCPRVHCPKVCSTQKMSNGCDKCTCSKGTASKICRQSPTRGNCRALKHKWTYDYKQKRCVSFVYGGCGGNENNFASKEQCERICTGL